MLERHKKEIDKYGLFIALLLLLLVTLYLLATMTKIMNIIVILTLASVGLSDVISYMRRFVDWFIEMIYYDNSKASAAESEEGEDVDNIKNVIVMCSSKEERILLIHEYISVLKSYGVEILYLLVGNYTAFSTDNVRVEFLIDDGLADILYYDESFDCMNEYNEGLIDYVLEQHGIVGKEEDDHAGMDI